MNIAEYSSLVNNASARIKSYLLPTPVMTSETINGKYPGHQVYFKAEMLQKTGAFKARGALNTLLWAKAEGALTSRVAAVSSGNHSQALAWAAAKLGVQATIFMAQNTSPIKVSATRAYGATVVLAEDRLAAEGAAREFVVAQRCLFVPPFDHDQIIAGQGTACLEAWQQCGPFDAVFVPCGGGGLMSGTIAAARLHSQQCQIFGVEPATANDAAESLRSGALFRFTKTPTTICDGVRTLGLSDRTFDIIRQHAAGIYEVSDDQALVWTRRLMHLLKLQIEPTSALAMAGADQWIRQQNMPTRSLVILSGGNLDGETSRTIAGYPFNLDD